MRQMAASSTDALQRPRKDRERFRRFIVDAVLQGECVPGGRRKLPPPSTTPALVDSEQLSGFTTDKAPATAADAAAAAVPPVSSAPLTSGEKDLLR